MFVWWVKIVRPQDIPDVIRDSERYRDRDYHYQAAYWRHDRQEIRIHFHGGVTHVWAKGVDGDIITWSLKWDNTAEAGGGNPVAAILGRMFDHQCPAEGDADGGDNGARSGARDVRDHRGKDKDVH